ncbi:Uncharacterised protein [Mycobacterium tuberculosis]|nr:Uncharacterised protein [Mycobacterium tuberculosis]
MPPPQRGELPHRVGAQAERAAEAAQPVRVGRDEMGAAQPVQLDEVLDPPQEPVRRRQRRRVVAPDVAAPRQGLQRVEGGPAAQGLVGAAVHELEQLHRELDVAQPARPELQLPFGVGGAPVQVGLDAAPHGLDVLDEALALGGLPHDRGDRVEVAGAEVGVPGDGAGLEQRLELPRLGPPLVVGAVAGEGPHQRPGLALGAQRGVDLPERALLGAGRARPHHRGREPGRGAQRGVLVVPVPRFRHEDHVDVADVVQLAAPGLAHADHGEPARPVLGDAGAGDREARLQRGRGEVGQLGGDLGDVRRADQVAAGQREQPPAVGDAERGERAVAAGHRLRGGRVGAHGGEQLGAGVPGRGGRAVAQHPPVVRMPGEVVAERGAHPEHGGEPLPRPRLGGEGRAQLAARAVLVGGREEPQQPVQRQVGVGGAAERVEEVVAGPRPGAALGVPQQPLGARGVGEAEPRQAPGEGGAAFGSPRLGHSVNRNP